MEMLEVADRGLRGKGTVGAGAGALARWVTGAGADDWLGCCIIWRDWCECEVFDETFDSLCWTARGPCGFSV